MRELDIFAHINAMPFQSKKPVSVLRRERRRRTLTGCSSEPLSTRFLTAYWFDGQGGWIKEGNGAATFLNEVTGERFVLAGMMCDAATETMNFIRKVDTENLDNADICSFIEHFLKHIWFLFYERGVLSVASHTSFIIEWLESRAVHFVVRGVGKSIGGVKVKLGATNRALEHMKAWVHLARACIEAEFPSFSLINAFSAFKLPRERSKNTKTFNEIVEAKLKRLATAFSKPCLKTQFKVFWFHAFVAYRDSNFNISSWVARRIGIEKGAGANKPHEDLLHVILRGQTWRI